MAELADAGAVGFSDDGLPIRSARVMRRALQYQTLVGGQIALHEEDPELSGHGVMHEGEVSAVLGMEGIPSVSESTMIARDAALAAYEGARIHVQHLSARESVDAVAAAKEAGVAITCEATPHHLTLTDDAVRSLDASFKMNPPLRCGGRPAGADRGGPLGPDRLHRDRPRAALPRGEGGAVRAGRDGRHRARDGVRGDLHGPRAARRARPRDRDRQDERGSDAVRVRAAGPRAGRRGQRRPARPRGRMGARRRRLGEPLGELLLRRAQAHGQAADDGGRRDRSPTGSGASRWGSHDGADRLRPPRGRDPARRRALWRRRRVRHRRGRLQHRDDRLPGGDDRPLLRRAAHHLHLPDDR